MGSYIPYIWLNYIKLSYISLAWIVLNSSAHTGMISQKLTQTYVFAKWLLSTGRDTNGYLRPNHQTAGIGFPGDHQLLGRRSSGRWRTSEKTDGKSDGKNMENLWKYDFGSQQTVFTSVCATSPCYSAVPNFSACNYFSLGCSVWNILEPCYGTSSIPVAPPNLEFLYVSRPSPHLETPCPSWSISPKHPEAPTPGSIQLCRWWRWTRRCSFGDPWSRGGNVPKGSDLSALKKPKNCPSSSGETQRIPVTCRNARSSIRWSKRWIVLRHASPAPVETSPGVSPP